MRNYLSFGGGVNSVAMLLLFHELEIEHEAVYVWMPDNPLTHDYLMLLESKGYKITIIFPWNQGHWNLYDYCLQYNMTPSYVHRWCTDKFKLRTLYKYFEAPAWVNIGIDAGESHRARFSSLKGYERRYPLIEHELDRKGCMKLIERHGLPIPIKSGCFFCCFQKRSQWEYLRKNFPDLWCKAVKMEENSMRYAKEKNKSHPGYLTYMNKPLTEIIFEKDRFLFKEMDYPPCECGL